jgi:serine/threonine protein kinase
MSIIILDFVKKQLLFDIFFVKHFLIIKMKCENVTCQNFINTASKCNKCESKFCSNSCMIDHFFEKHKSEKEENNIARSLTIASMKKQKRKSSVSSFAKAGQILTHVKAEDYFKFENFEKVKVGKKTQVLGSGAFGDVYLIKHKQDGKLFAVKKMDKEKILNSGASLEIVRREIDIHSRLLHENIVRLFSSYEDNLSFHLILEYANSGTLFGAIKKNKSMEEKKAFKYFIQTASALYFLHENNLIHRDIKPENLLLDSNDNVKLCDFGWCIELEIGNRKTFCGTIEYMAPEIVKEMPYDGAIDVWSIGVLLYELLHGYSPFRALQNQNEDAEAAEVFRNIVKVQYKIDRKDISDQCKDLIKSNAIFYLELLTPEISSRMKIKDVFSHPWVVYFEKEILEKENTGNSFNNSENSKLNKSAVEKLNYSENMGLKKLKELEMELKKIENIQNISVDKNNKKQLGTELLKNSKNVNINNSIEKIKENLNYQKKNSIKQALDSSDFQLENIQRSDSLFDKVLTQVKERNKGMSKG